MAAVLGGISTCVGFCGRGISEGVEVTCAGIKVLSNVFLTVEGADKLTKLVIRVIAWTENTEWASIGLDNLAKMGKVLVRWVEVFDAFKQISNLKEKHGKMTWSGLAASISIVTLRIFNVIDFLNDLKLLDKPYYVAAIINQPFLLFFFSKVASIPYLGLALQAKPLLVLGAVGIGFKLFDFLVNQRPLQSQELELSKKVHALWQLRQRQLGMPDADKKSAESDAKMVVSVAPIILGGADELKKRHEDLGKEFQTIQEQIAKIGAKIPKSEIIKKLDTFGALSANPDKDTLNGLNVTAILSGKPNKEQLDYLKAKVRLEERRWSVIAHNAELAYDIGLRAFFTDLFKQIALSTELINVSYGLVSYLSTKFAVHVYKTISDGLGGWKVIREKGFRSPTQSFSVADDDQRTITAFEVTQKLAAHTNFANE